MRFGRYDLVGRLGEGSSAVVHLARDAARDAHVVLKALRADDERSAARFRREFSVVAGLRHPNVLRVLDFGTADDGTLFYTAEHHPEGRSLRAALDAGATFDERAVVDLAAATLRGLEYVHTRGLVHRDLKPENLLVVGPGAHGEDGAGLEVLLTDFGLAVAAHEDDCSGGTLHYVAPEVLRRDRADRRADLYAVGVILYEVLTGRPPHDARDAAELARLHLEDRPHPPSAVRPGCCREELERVVLRLLEKEPADRYPSANAVIEALAQATGRALPFETSETKEAYVLSGRFVGRERELDWLHEAWRRAIGPLDWERDPRAFDRRTRFATGLGGGRADEPSGDGPALPAGPRGATASPIAARVVGGAGERRRAGSRRRELDGAVPPPALLVLVRGESGLGKTRLAAELGRRCQLDGATVLAGGCTPHLARGYEPFVAIAQEAARLATPAELERAGWALERLLGRGGGAAAGGGAPAGPSSGASSGASAGASSGAATGEPGRAGAGAPVDRLRLVDAVAELLLAVATRRPLLVLVEGLHAARAETLELLGHLHRSLVTTLAGAEDGAPRPRLLCVATYRPTEAAAPELGRAVRAWRRDRFVEELTLRPLGADDVGELLRSMLGVPSIPRAFVERVAQGAGGNPLLVEMLMEELVARGIVDRARGLWRLDAERALAADVPAGRVPELALARLGRLPGRDLLDWLAVLDRAAPAALLAELAGRPEEAVAGELEGLAAARVLTRAAGPAGERGARAALAHARLRDVLYGALALGGGEERAARHLAVARALAPGVVDRPAPGEVAHHLLEAGAGLEAIAAARAAATEAAGLGARERAAELLGRALRLTDELLARCEHDAARAGPLRRERLACSRALVHELTALERLAEARSQTLEGLALARALGDAEAEVAALAHLGALNTRLKAVEDGKRWFFEALKTAERLDYGRGVGRSLVGLGEASVEEGRLDEAVEWLERSLAFARDLGDEREVARTLRALGRAHERRGDLAQAEGHAQDALALDEAAGDRAGAAQSLAQLADLRFLRGDWAGAVDAGERALGLARVHGDREAEARALLGLGTAHERRGARDEARRALGEAAALARRVGRGDVLAQALTGLGWTRLLAGDVGEALADWNEATTLRNLAGDREGYALGLVALGGAYARRGDLERAASCLDAAARVAWEVVSRRVELEASWARAAVELERGGEVLGRELLDKAALRARELRAPRVEALALADEAAALARAGQGDAGLRAAQRARAVAAQAGEPDLEARVALRAAEVDLARGALAAALGALEAREAWLAATGDRVLAVEAELLWGRALAAAGDHEQALGALDAALAEARARGLRPLAARARLARGEALLERGLGRAAWRPGRVVVGSADLGEARASLEAARTDARALGARGLAAEAGLALARFAQAEDPALAGPGSGASAGLGGAGGLAGAALAELEAAGAEPAAGAQPGAVARASSPTLVCHAALLEGEAAAARGDPEAALVRLDDLDLLGPRERARRAVARALACERAGRPLEARAALGDGQAALEALGADLAPALRARLDETWVAIAVRSLLREGGAARAPAPPDAGRLRALLDAAAGVQAARGLEATLRAVVDRSLALFGAERGFLCEAGPDGAATVLAGRRAPDGDLPAAERRTSSHVVLRAIEGDAPLVVTDAQADLAVAERPSVVDLGLKSVLAWPLRDGGRARWAVVVEDRGRAGRFGPEDRALAAELAALVGPLVERARLEEEAARQRAALEARAAEVARLEAALAASTAEQRAALDEVRAELERREVELGARAGHHKIVGQAEPMQRVFGVLEKVARSDVPVLIQGESGTGKELVARAVHDDGPRAKGPFLSINCAALPESLLEAELFGHVRGAFTGADRDKTGLLEAADGGTLFLDEVGDMPLAMQSKLLRALQEGEVRPLGARAARKVDVRVVSASNKDLRRLVDDGQFRADLFYRLNVVCLVLPPLRERREDIPLLVEHLLDKIARGDPDRRKAIDRKVTDALLHHDWPGNVRELENELRRLVALSGPRILERDLSPHLRQRRHDKVEVSVVADEGRTLKERLEGIERRILIESLRHHDFNKTRTAKVLGLSRYGFLKKLDKYSLREDELASGG